MKVLTPPQSLNTESRYDYRLFLAGSIEMGNAPNWQQDVIEGIKSKKYLTFNPIALNYGEAILVYNPRRKDWDSTWEQKIENSQFYQQVSWELHSLERATHIFFYLAEDTLSPISLLELGKFSTMKDKKLVVVCHPDFKRKGNVDIFCERYNIAQADSIEKGLSKLFAQ